MPFENMWQQPFYVLCSSTVSVYKKLDYRQTVQKNQSAKHFETCSHLLLKHVGILEMLIELGILLLNIHH